MTIFLDNVIPSPMQEENLEASEVWNKQLSIDSKKRYFLSSNSGKGKSTFLNFIVGLRNDYKGTLTIDGKTANLISLKDWAKIRSTKIAYLPQDLQLINHLTVWENLILKNNLTNHYTSTEIESFLAQFSLSTFKDRKINTLSIGQQQRVALIRTVLQPLDLLLLDEPFSHLDEENIKICLNLIDSVCKKEAAGFIIATLGYNYGVNSIETLLL